MAVGNAGGRLFALDDTCLHRGGSLACGHLDGQVLVCPMHWWRYDVHSGRRLGQPGLRVATYPVRVVDGEVRVVTPAPPPRSWREVLLEHAREGPGEGRGARLRRAGAGDPVRAAGPWRGRSACPGDLRLAGAVRPGRRPAVAVAAGRELTEPAYWARRAAEAGQDGARALMARLFDGPEDELVRPQARALVAEARAAGLEMAVLTNDLHAFHDQVWIDRMRVLAEVGCVVDTAQHGTRKPEPAAYRLVLDRLGVAADQAVLVDDQPANTAGAEAAGMAAVWFDVTRPDHSYQQVRQAIGLADDGGRR